MPSIFKCIDCRKSYPLGFKTRCECGGLLEVKHEFRERIRREIFDKRADSKNPLIKSGVWRFKELVYPELDNNHIITKPEGNTNLYTSKLISSFVGTSNLYLKHEGENPTGSFKDRGMTVGVSEAKRLGMTIVACASTGNTSSSLSSYAATAGLKCIVFLPEGRITYGKLAQTLAYGATVIQVKGSFDDAMRIVQQVSEELSIYLLNSINPWRIEGQKTIVFELIQQLNWKPPDWIILPAGNLGNTSAFGKALTELEELDLIDEKPRLAAIQAEGADPFYRLWLTGSSLLEPNSEAKTIASAIRIGNPVSWKKALFAIKNTNGVVEHVSDQEIMDSKIVVDRSGIGCEPASAASVAGAKKLLDSGVIDKGEKIVCILTGNILKDPDSTIRYFEGDLPGIKPNFLNSLKIVEPSIIDVRKILEL